MSNHENLVKRTGQQVSRRIWLRQTLKVVSELSLGDVNAAESTVQSGLAAQMSHFPNLAADNLGSIAGRAVDIFEKRREVDLEAIEKRGLVGESHKSPAGDTYAYSAVLDEKGGKRVLTIAFTSKSREEVISNLGEPAREELKPAA